MRDLTPVSDTAQPRRSSSWEWEGKGGLRAPDGLGEPEICLPKISILETRTYYGKHPGAINGPFQAFIVPFSHRATVLKQHQEDSKLVCYN